MNSKYEIELEEMYVRDGAESTQNGPERLYRVKGFNSLVFDDEGLKKLKKASVNDNYEKVQELERQVEILKKKCKKSFEEGRKSALNDLAEFVSSNKEKSCDGCEPCHKKEKRREVRSSRIPEDFLPIFFGDFFDRF
jgi:hypothetical protein